MSIDDILPDSHLRELHRAPAGEDAAAALRAATEVTWREVPRTRRLMMIGSAKLDTSVFDEMAGQLGFRELERTEHELVMGTVLKLPFAKAVPFAVDGRPARESFAAFDKPGHLRVVFNFRHENGELCTQTRGHATSSAGAVMARIGWAVIRLPSGMTRKEWLRAAVARLRPAPDGTG